MVSCSDDDGSNMTSNNDADQPAKKSSSNGSRKVSLVTTFMGVVGAIAVGLFASKQYVAIQSATLSVTDVAPQCEASNSSGPLAETNDDKKVAFRYAKIDATEKPEEEDDDDDEDEDDGDDDANENLSQFWINADDVQGHFDNYDSTNGEEIITEFLEGLLESSEACENLFELYGHFAHDTKKLGGNRGTLQAMGLFRYGMGRASVTAWPAERKVMVDILVGPPQSTEKEKYHDDDDDEEDDAKSSEENFTACIDSMAVFLYPDDVIEPNGIKGDIGNVKHMTKLGPMWTYQRGQDPFNMRWWTNMVRRFQLPHVNEHDILEEMGSSDDWRNHVQTVQSPFQRIDIIDGQDDYDTATYAKYFEKPEYREVREYIAAHPEFFLPDRMLYLDGVIQSTLEGLAAYHEALVHPAMFTHPSPKRVGIVGGGECATLRETLKHNTVETVVMVEIDPVIVEVSKEYLPQWNDCSMFEGSSRYCMDDPRVEMYHLDALKWFRDRFSNEARLEGNELYGTEEKFDVVILDALDPQNAVDFVEALYGDGPFMNSLYNSLTDDGVLLTQVGEALYIGDISETYPGNFNYQRSRYEAGLKNQGFAAVMNYEEARAGFDGIWSFYAAFKNDSSRARWQMNEAQLDLEIQKRSVRMVGDEKLETGEIRSLFDYFDGPTMKTYRYPSRDAQVVYCLRDPKPYGCTNDVNDHYAQQIPLYEPVGFDPETPNVSAEHFAVSESGGLVSRVEVPENSYLMLEQSIHGVAIPPLTSEVLESKGEDAYDRTIDPVRNFVSGDRQGLTIPRRGDMHSVYRVDSGLLAFLQHGCGGSFNTESLHSSSLSEDTADPDAVPEDGLLGRTFSSAVVNELIFNPAFTRNSHRPEFVLSSRAIPEGGEITSNFVPWLNPAAGWKGHIESLRSRCAKSDPQ